MDVLSLSAFKYPHDTHIKTMSAYNFFFPYKIESFCPFSCSKHFMDFLWDIWIVSIRAFGLWGHANHDDHPDHQDGYCVANGWVVCGTQSPCTKGRARSAWGGVLWRKISLCSSEWHATQELHIVYLWNLLLSIFKAWLIVSNTFQEVKPWRPEDTGSEAWASWDRIQSWGLS